MRISTRKHTSSKVKAREKKRLRIRKTVAGSVERPRLSVYRSTRHVYAQVIDDTKGVTLVAASTQDLEGVKGSSKASAAAVGAEIAKRAVAKKIKAVVFDRSGYLYHGKIQALAEAARQGGLEF